MGHLSQLIFSTTDVLSWIACFRRGRRPHRRLPRLHVMSSPFSDRSVVPVRLMHRGLEVALADAKGPTLVQDEQRDAEQAHADRDPRRVDEAE